MTWLVAPRSEFVYTAGEPKVLRSSDRGTRYFCAECGTPLTCVVHAHPDSIDVTVSTLDDPERVHPRRDFYRDTRLSWVPAFPEKKGTC